MNLRLAGLYLLIVSLSTRADSLNAILGRMDAAAPDFHGVSADVSMVTHEKVLDDNTTEQGSLQMQRVKAGDVRAILSFTGKSSARTLFFQGKKLLIYYPETDYYQEFDLGSKSQLLNQYLLLGFGSSGKELADSYEIKENGEAAVAGRNTTMLVLVPKSDPVKQNLSQIELWIPADGANPVQQKFFQANGDSRTVTYTNVQTNPPMAGKLKFQVPGTAQKR